MDLSIVIIVCDKDYKFLKKLYNNIEESVELSHEIIIVDNRKKHRFLKLPHLKNTRVITEGKNTYQFEARRFAINYCNGNYVWFIDADDSVFRVGAKFHNNLTKDTDVIAFNASVEESKGNIFSLFTEIPNKIYSVKDDTIEDFSINNESQLWNKFIKVEFFKKIVKDYFKDNIELINDEDFIYSMYCINFASSIESINEFFYFYNRKDSNIEKICDYDDMMIFFKNNDYIVAKLYELRKMSNRFNTLPYIYNIFKKDIVFSFKKCKDKDCLLRTLEHLIFIFEKYLDRNSLKVAFLDCYDKTVISYEDLLYSLFIETSLKQKDIVINTFNFNDYIENPLIKVCINSWKKEMPEAKIKIWTIDDCMPIINKFDFAKKALENKAYSYVADIVRLYLSTTIDNFLFLDGDVYLHKDLTELLNSCNCLTSSYRLDRNRLNINNGTIQWTIDKNNQFIHDILNSYKNLDFRFDNHNINVIEAVLDRETRKNRISEGLENVDSFLVFTEEKLNGYLQHLIFSSYSDLKNKRIIDYSYLHIVDYEKEISGISIPNDKIDRLFLVGPAGYIISLKSGQKVNLCTMPYNFSKEESLSLFIKQAKFFNNGEKIDFRYNEVK